MRMRAFLSPTVGDHQMADAKRKRVAGGEPEEGGYVRLAPSVAKFMGGKRYCKEPELDSISLVPYVPGPILATICCTGESARSRKRLLHEL